MFNRKEIKKKAWAHAKGYWKIPLLLTLGIIVSLVIILGCFFIVLATAPDANIVTSSTNLAANSHDPTSVFIGFVILIIYAIFIMSVMMAFCYFFFHFAHDNKGTNVKTFFEGLSLWHKGTRGFLWSGLWVSLWSMIFYIPGIIKAIAYSQMFFILADKKNIGVCKSMRISKEITKGYKADLFFMALSFTGWIFLTMIPYAIGSTMFALNPEANIVPLFVGLFLYIVLITLLMPYMMTSYVYAYDYLLASALERKIITPVDLGEKTSIQEEGENNV